MGWGGRRLFRSPHLSRLSLPASPFPLPAQPAIPLRSEEREGACRPPHPPDLAGLESGRELGSGFSGPFFSPPPPPRGLMSC